MAFPYLDRQAVEKLFLIRERRARQLMAGLPGLQVGNAFAVDRLALLKRMEETRAGDRCQWERNRRTRVVEELDRSRRQLAARCVVIPAAPRAENQLFIIPVGSRQHPIETGFDGIQSRFARTMPWAQVIESFRLEIIIDAITHPEIRIAARR